MALLSAPAAAHHILGIPHYKYSEEYPQIPYVEVEAQTPHSELHFTYMPGTPRPGQDVRFKLYAKSLTDGTPRTPPMKVEVMKNSFIGDPEPVMEAFTIEPGVGPEANDFKFFLRFEEAEAFIVRVHYLDENDQTEVIDFPVTIGETDDRPLIAAAFGIIVFAAAAVGITKRRRGRRKKKGA
jgi:hypothetical protein